MAHVRSVDVYTMSFDGGLGGAEGGGGGVEGSGSVPIVAGENGSVSVAHDKRDVGAAIVMRFAFGCCAAM